MPGRDVLQYIVVMTLVGACPVLAATKPPALPDDWQIITRQDARECGVNTSPNSGAWTNPAKLPDDGSVWRVGSLRWSEEDERKYAEFISEKVGTDFLTKFHLKADCADATAVLRSVFARIHSLPIYFKSVDSFHKTGNFVKRFVMLPTIRDWNERNWETNLLKDKRFRAYLAEIPDAITASDMNDNTYPIEVYDPRSPRELSEYFMPGALFAKADHVKMIHEIDPNQWYPFRQYSATTPASEQEFTEYQAELQEPQRRDLGVVRWNWAVNCGGSVGWRQVKDERMPGFSYQQFDYITSELKKIEGKELGWYLDTIGRAKGMTSPPPGTVEREIDALQKYIEKRVPLVLTALQCQRTGCRGLIPPFDDENYSTPSFDRTIETRYALIEKLVRDYGSVMEIRNQDDLTRYVNRQSIDPQRPDGRTTSLFFFVYAYRQGAASSNYLASSWDRWGLAALERLAVETAARIAALRESLRPIQERLSYNQSRLAELQLELELLQTQPDPSLPPEEIMRRIQEVTAGINQYQAWCDADTQNLKDAEASIASVVDLAQELDDRGFREIP